MPGVRGWHAGMTTVNILDQLSSVYGKPTAAALDANDTIFRSPYSADDAPEVLFRRIEECAEIAMLGDNPYTDRQLVVTAVHLLLTTGLYIRAFEDGTSLLQWIKHGLNSAVSSKMHLNDALMRRRQRRAIKDMPLPSPTCSTTHSAHSARRMRPMVMILWILLPHRWLQ